MDLNESREMYLETIYVLSKKLKTVRQLDVADYMEFSKPSVNRAVGILKSSDLITTDVDGHLLLTAEGLKIAKKTYDKHVFLSKFFEKIGVPEDIATEDACKIEHVISDTTLKALKKHSQDYCSGT